MDEARKAAPKKRGLKEAKESGALSFADLVAAMDARPVTIRDGEIDDPGFEPRRLAQAAARPEDAGR